VTRTERPSVGVMTGTEGISVRAIRMLGELVSRTEGISVRVMTRTEGISVRVIRMLSQLVGFNSVERARGHFDVFF